MAQNSSVVRLVYLGTTQDTLIDIRAFEDGTSTNNLHIATIKITTIAGVKKETVTIPFREGHKYLYSALLQYAKDYGYDMNRYDQEVDVIADYTAKTVTFTVTAASGGADIEDADVTFNGETIATDVSGEALFSNVPEGASQAYSVVKATYTTGTGTVTVDGDEAVAVALVLA